MPSVEIDRVILLGLDGATWTLLQPWVQQGRLPGLARAMQQGSHGALHSSTPPYSAPAWVSLATGMNPGKHGVVDFWQPAPDGRGEQPISALSAAAPTLWEQLGQAGRRVALFNVPVTYPPRPVNGLLVSGMLTPHEEAAWSHPPALKEELQSLPGGYLVNPYATAAQSEEFLQRVLTWVPQRERAHRQMLERERWSLFFNVVQASDTIQHHFWNCLDPAHPAYDEHLARRYDGLLQRCYAAMDAVIQNRLALLDERTALILMSDHGFGPAHKYVHVNRLLADMGLLVFEGGRPARGGISMSGLYRLLRRLDPWNLRGRLSNRLRQRLRQQVDRAIARPIDWSRSRAYSGRSTGESIYINLRGRDPRGIVEPGQEYEALRDKVIQGLLDLRDPDSGERVVEQAWRKEEIYHGPQLPWLPDVLFQVSPHPYLPTDRLSVDDLFEEIAPSIGGGRHQSEGILVLAGAPFQQGLSIQDAQITDVAPTVLYLLGLPVPEDMDGRVLEETLDPGYRRAHPIQQGPPVGGESQAAGPSPYSEQEVDEIAERLRGLGYV
ncbi:MAG: alkaline phosphatase family protein [Chloroflexia bacterium]|nr:alkaline phosphatase family protein [Chloroflexia bacterium]